MSHSLKKAIADDDTFLPYSATRARYGNPAKSTFNRWIETGEFPQPAMLIGTRRFWSLRALKEHDAKRMARGAVLPEPAQLKRHKAA